MNCLVPNVAEREKYPFESATAIIESGNEIICARGRDSPFLSRTEPLTVACCAADNRGKQNETMMSRVFTIQFYTRNTTLAHDNGQCSGQSGGECKIRIIYFGACSASLFK